MNLIRACRGQLILTLLLLAAILVMPFQDYTERRLTAEDMNYLGGWRNPEHSRRCRSSGFIQ